jgi:flagellar motor component MotA
MRKMYVVGAVLFIALILGAIITSGGRVQAYLSIPCFVMVPGCTFVLLLTNFSVREMGRSFAVGFRKKDADIEDLKRGFVFFQSMQYYLILSGVLGTMVGTIALLSNLKDSSTIGSGTALALITILYGVVFLMLVAIPFKTGIKKRIVEAGAKVPNSH